MSLRSVLVTGSSGMIGTVLSERLLRQGIEVTGVDIAHNQWSAAVNDVTIEADLRNLDEIGRLPEGVDVIVHLAANARVHQLVRNPERARDNFETTFNVLEFARQAGVPNVVLGSSREVYGNKGKVVCSETDTYVDECESPYTASKIGAEAMTKAYDRCYGIDSCVLRFSNVYGKYDESDRVMPLFIAQAHHDRPLTVYGAEKLLDFTHVHDCVRGITMSIDNFEKAKGTTFNVASGNGASLLEVAEEIIEQTSSNSDVRIEASRTGEVDRYVADISKARKMLDYHPEYGLPDGIAKAIDWYQRHQQLLNAIV